jgi:Fe2+ or Zn2+ uptake regulation protein
MAMSFRERVTEAQRLALLQLLASTPGHPAADTLLAQALPDMGLAATLDQVRTQIAWLADQGLVEVEEVGGITLARVLAAGADTANGLRSVPGVARPAPRR